MPVGVVIPMPKAQFLDDSGNPLVGGLLYSYAAGTSTPLSTYSDSALTTPNANPVVLDAAGRATIYLTPATSYKFTLKTAAAATVWTQDAVTVTAADAIVTSIIAGTNITVGYTGPTAGTGDVTVGVGAQLSGVYTGGIALASQAQYDLMYASAAAQWARIAGTALSVLKTNSSKVPALLAATALQSVRVNIGGTDWEPYTPSTGMSLYGQAEGTDTNVAAANVATFAITGLTVKDTLRVVFRFSSPTAQTAGPILAYNSTDSVVLANLCATVAGDTFTAGSMEFGVDQGSDKSVISVGPTFTPVTIDGTNENGFSNWGTRTVTTAWTGNWTLAIRHGGVTATGTFRYRVAVYRVAGQ